MTRMTKHQVAALIGRTPDGEPDPFGADEEEQGTPVAGGKSGNTWGQATTRQALCWNRETAKYEMMVVTFGSGAESRRYAELELMAAAGEIKDLVPHDLFIFEIIPGAGLNPGEICRYTSDACYFEQGEKGWTYVVEDVKSVRHISRDFPIRKKLMLRIFDVQVRIIDSDDYQEERRKPRSERERPNAKPRRGKR